MIKKVVLSAISLIIFGSLTATPPNLSVKPLSYPPHRVIRTCCAFGSDLKIVLIPGIKYNDITSIERIGPHKYLGDEGEGNGIIYSRNGGFIDLGHLRDCADWTAYIYSQVLLSKKNGKVVLQLGREGGLKTLKLNVPSDLDENDAVLLAGRIAYDLSIWHEIASWFGCSAVPLLTERFSSFSVEDPYSNLLGVTVGMRAIKSDLPYDNAMSLLIRETLTKLGSVPDENETYLAMEAVRNIWWTRDKSLPSAKVLITRQLDVYSCQTPWLVPGWEKDKTVSSELEVPKTTVDGRSLEDFYELGLKLNSKFPSKEMFPARNNHLITQADFGILLDRVAKDLSN
jgi:hypothetical protein